MQRLFLPTTALSCLAFVLVFGSSTALAQYQLTKLTSNQAGQAKHQDALLHWRNRGSGCVTLNRVRISEALSRSLKFLTGAVALTLQFRCWRFSGE